MVILLVSAAHAQEVPELNAQLYRTSVDAQKTMWTDDATKADDHSSTALVSFLYTDSPLVYDDGEGNVTEIVASALQANIVGGYTIDRLRMALDLPLYLSTRSDIAGEGAGLGDIALDFKVNVLDNADEPVGVALGVRTSFPTAGVDVPMGGAGFGWEAQGIVSKQFEDWLLAANLGTRGVPTATLENVEVDDQFFFRMGAGYSITDATGVSGDLVGQLGYGEVSNLAGNPVEVMFGGWGQVADMLRLRGGVGTGVSRGIGSPAFRAVASLALVPAEEKDTDLDGLLDRMDRCPTDPEDEDGYQDDDGCPDPSYDVMVRAVDGSGSTIDDAALVISGPEAAEGSSGMQAKLHAGEYTINATADGYLGSDKVITINADGQHEMVLEAMTVTGGLRVMVTDPDNKPLEATVAFDEGKQRSTGDDGMEDATLEVGNHHLVVRAEGYRSEELTVSVQEDQLAEVMVKLSPSRVKVTHKKIEILDKVYFETNKSTIKDVSFALLNEIARILKDNAHIKVVRVEGHTDSRGADSYNLQLSDDRAKAVREYLVLQGVDASRLVSEGYGETKPVDTRENRTAWEKNRRVEFTILEQEE